MVDESQTSNATPLSSRSVLSLRPGNPLIGEISSYGEASLPGDKSISHRCALFASLASGVSHFNNFQVSGVTRPLLLILHQLGVNWHLENDYLTVEGQGIGSLRKPDQALYCGNSATTMRLVTGAMAAAGIECELDGSSGLRKRPMNRIVEPLRDMGVKIESANGYAPIKIRGAELPLTALHHELPIASAQVKSCILLAGLSAKGTTTILEPGPSRDHSERLLASMGVDITRVHLSDRSGSSYQVELTSSGSASLQPLNMRLPGDFSAASFLIVAACITPGSHLVIRDVGLNPTRTGLLDVLRNMGAKIDINETGSDCGEPLGNLSIHHSSLTGTQVSGEVVVRMIDEFPAFAVAAALAKGVSRVSGASELRQKESDRIRDLCRELRKLGVNVSEETDGFIIHGGNQLSGGHVNHEGDHRLAMSLAVAGLTAKDPVTISQPEIINESFPSFIPLLKMVGADIELL